MSSSVLWPFCRPVHAPWVAANRSIGRALDTADGAATIGLVPIYEFRCERCGGRFEELVEVGTETVACRSCGAERTTRVYSAQGAPFKMVQTGSELRKQERSNSQLRERTRSGLAGRRGRAGESGRGSA
jgi:putative FmdB family regulatory protein